LFRLHDTSFLHYMGGLCPQQNRKWVKLQGVESYEVLATNRHVVPLGGVLTRDCCVQ